MANTMCISIVPLFRCLIKDEINIEVECKGEIINVSILHFKGVKDQINSEFGEIPASLTTVHQNKNRETAETFLIVKSARGSDEQNNFLITF